MTHESHTEADTRAKFISPMLKERNWREEMIKREQTDRAIEFGPDGHARRGLKKVDYLLHIAVSGGGQTVPVALIEAKKTDKPPASGIEQAKEYARKCPKFKVPFLYSTNGRLFVEFDCSTEKFSNIRPLDEFPTPDELRARYESARGFSLADEAAAPLLFPYSGKSGTPRYYQDAAIRAAMEKLAEDAKKKRPSRILLSLATGAGKTFIVANLIRRLAEAGKMKRALFLCDRVALRDQALAEFRKEFGDEAAIVEEAQNRNVAKNARVHIATYQTLGADSNDRLATYRRFYPNSDHFSHIVIDECHRSAWHKWCIPLEKNPNAAHIGLTATPREFKEPVSARRSKKSFAYFLRDQGITAHNLKYFGDPVYEYFIDDGVKDGYLAACKIGLLRPNLDISGLSKPEVIARDPIDANTGGAVDYEEIAENYSAPAYEADILLPDRVTAMSADLFRRITNDDSERGPDQKTIVFCASDSHAERVAHAMQNLRVEWAKQRRQRAPRNYAFKCTADSDGSNMLSDFKGSNTDFFVATTVDLLSTGVDVPPVRNIAFFRYLKSPIAFRQMMGRGTRIYKPANKIAFCVYDYTGAFQLLGEDLEVAAPSKKSEKTKKPDDYQPRRQILSEGYEVWVNELATAVLVRDEKGERWMQLEEYKNAIAQKLLKDIRDPEIMRSVWTTPQKRRELLDALARAGLSPAAALQMEGREEQDLFDYLNELAWSADPMTRYQRANRFFAKNAKWLNALPQDAKNIVCAIVSIFAKGGTDQLESIALFDAPEVAEAGGRRALGEAGDRAKMMTEVKRRLFAG